MSYLSEIGPEDGKKVPVDVKVAANGRLVLPRAVRDALGIEGEAKVVMIVDDGGVQVESVRDGVLRAQALYRKHVRHPSTVDDVLAGRKAEALREG